MQIRQLLALSFMVKAGILVLCFSLVYGHYVTARLWFNPNANRSAIIAAVRSSSDVNSVNDDGLTGLMFAAIYGKLALAKTMLDVNADPTIRAKKKSNNTALHFACYNGDVDDNLEIARLLIKYGAQVRAKRDDGFTPIHDIALIDHLDKRTAMLSLLIKHGADINAQSIEGDTIMHLVVNNKNKGWIERVMKEFGSLVDLTIKNKKGYTPREYAWQFGFRDTAVVLDRPLVRIENPGERDPNGLTTLMLAAIKGDVKEAEKLLVGGSVINALSNDRFARTPLHFAVLSEHIPIIALLIKRGALQTIVPDGGKETVLHKVSRISDPKKRVPAAQLLLNKRELLNMQNDLGDTLLHRAARAQQVELVKYLVYTHAKELKKGIKNKKLERPVDIARRIGNQELVLLLA